MASEPLDLLQGTLDVRILKTLGGGPMHGYGVSRWVRQRTGDVLAASSAGVLRAPERGVCYRHGPWSINAGPAAPVRHRPFRRNMLPPPPAPSRLPGYGLGVPTEADAFAALQRVFGPERGATLWFDACRAAGLAAGQVDDSARLERVARLLAGQGGAAATVARSIEIRLRTYALLASRAAAPRAGVPT